MKECPLGGVFDGMVPVCVITQRSINFVLIFDDAMSKEDIERRRNEGKKKRRKKTRLEKKVGGGGSLFQYLQPPTPTHTPPISR